MKTRARRVILPRAWSGCFRKPSKGESRGGLRIKLACMLEKAIGNKWICDYSLFFSLVLLTKILYWQRNRTGRGDFYHEVVSRIRLSGAANFVPAPVVASRERPTCRWRTDFFLSRQENGRWRAKIVHRGTGGYKRGIRSTCLCRLISIFAIDRLGKPLLKQKRKGMKQNHYGGVLSCGQTQVKFDLKAADVLLVDKKLNNLW